MPRSLSFFAKLGHGGGGACLFIGTHLECNNGAGSLVVVWIADWLVKPGLVLHDSPAQNIQPPSPSEKCEAMTPHEVELAVRRLVLFRAPKVACLLNHFFCVLFKYELP